MYCPAKTFIYSATLWSNDSLFKNEKAIEIQLLRPTEVCGKVLSEKNGYKSVKDRVGRSGCDLLWVHLNLNVSLSFDGIKT